MFDRKLIAVSAGFAFILSAIAGISGGVPLFTLLVRALFGAVAFAAFSTGAMTVIRRYLPELLPDRVGGPPESESEAGTGAGVNIVLPEEAPDEFRYRDNGESDEEEPDEQYGDIAEEVSESSERGSGTFPGAEAGVGESIGEDDDVEEFDIQSSPDALPDLDMFADTFSGSAGSDNEGLDSDGSSRAGDDQDPAIMAKAVRTILRKDQEGNR